MWALLVLLGLMLALPPPVTPAAARMHAGPNMLTAGHRLRAISGPLDAITTPTTMAFSFRKLRAAYAGNAVRLRRISGGALLDIGFTAAGDFDLAAAAAHCSTACDVDTWYDQSGNGRNLAATAPVHLTYVASCTGGQPCMRNSGANTYMEGPDITWLGSITTFGAVAKRVSGTGTAHFMKRGGSGNVLALHSTVNNWVLSDNVTAFLVPATDAAWHAVVGVVNGAGSLYRVDTTDVNPGVPIAGDAPTFTHIWALNGLAGTVFDTGEMLVWDNYALTLPERTGLTANQKSYWGF